LARDVTSQTRTKFFWAVLTIVLAAPIIAAAMSPQLAWRQPIYILASFAGVFGLAILLIQPLLASASIPGIKVATARKFHRWVGVALVVSVVVHVAGLWITSPPDVIDALLFASPTPFSVWGVIAMWALFTAAVFAGFRGKLRQRLRLWRISHKLLVSVTVVCSVLHAIKVDGTMELVTKMTLCGLVLLATLVAVTGFRFRQKL